MKKLWLTYAWKDNETNDVDFIAQRLREQHVEVKQDKNQLLAGKRLWQQLDEKISWSDIDAWAIFVTENSLKSEPCQEELAYAIDRALRTKGTEFPIIGIFPTPIDRQLIPSAIATRLWVHLKDENWSRQIIDTLSGTNSHQEFLVAATEMITHIVDEKIIVEMRPREGNWYPAGISIPAAEFDEYFITAFKGPRATPKTSSPMIELSEIDGTASNGERMKGLQIQSQIDSTCSLYAVFKKMPSIIFCGGKRMKGYYPPNVPTPCVWVVNLN